MVKVNYKSASGLALLGILATTAVATADPPVHAKLVTRQDASGVFFDPQTTIDGSAARLQRSADAIWIKVNTTGLPAGAYTVWAVTFNNPDACALGAGNCGAGDLPPTSLAPDGSVMWASGGIVEENGVGHFRAHIEEGMPPGQVLRGSGLNDAENAEVHIIVRYHGPVGSDAATALLQTTTVAGGCGVFLCFEPQSARFPL